MVKGANHQDYQDEAEKILREGRRRYRDELGSWRVGGAVKDGAMASIQANFLWYKTQSGQCCRADRSIVGAVFSFLSALVSEKNRSQLIDNWKNAQDFKGCVGAITSYFANAFASAGLGWLSSAFMIAVEEFIEENMMKKIFTDLTTNQIVFKACAEGAYYGCIAMTTWDVISYHFGFSDRKEDPLTFANLSSNAACSIVSGLLNYACVTFAVGGWAHVLLTFCVLWVVGQIIEGIRKAGFTNYAWSWVACWYSGTAEYDYDEDLEIPEDMQCPITLQPFVDPVWCLDSMFERRAVEEWIIQHGTHPLAGKVKVSIRGLDPSSKMKNLVTKFMSENNGTYVYRNPMGNAVSEVVAHITALPLN